MKGGKVVGLSFGRLDLKDNTLYITEGMLKKLQARAPPEDKYFYFRQFLVEDLKEAKEVKKGLSSENIHKSIRSDSTFVIHNVIAKQLLAQVLFPLLKTKHNELDFEQIIEELITPYKYELEKLVNEYSEKKKEVKICQI